MRLWLWIALCACSNESSPQTSTDLELEGIRARVASNWQPSPPDVIERLERAARADDPSAEVRVKAAAPASQRAPAIAIVVARHSPEYSQDATVRTMSRDAAAKAESEAAASGIEVKASHSCAAHHCTVSFTLGSDVKMHMRTQYWRVAGVLFENGCMGTDASAVAACTLPPPPANAEPVPPS